MELKTGKPEDTVYTHSFAAPVGTIHVAVDRIGRAVYVGYTPLRTSPGRVATEENKYACGELQYELEEYFAGRRNSFTVETRLEGTSFQKSVWSRLTRIGFGETMTYGEVARKIGRRDAARAVGNAVAANPVALLVPCHRVIPSTGGIGSYARRGLDERDGRRIKRLLLELESGQRELSV
jgi:methylated-DNA-[protein]-cysteine S-methyltransferase